MQGLQDEGGWDLATHTDLMFLACLQQSLRIATAQGVERQAITASSFCIIGEVIHVR